MHKYVSSSYLFKCPPIFLPKYKSLDLTSIHFKYLIGFLIFDLFLTSSGSPFEFFFQCITSKVCLFHHSALNSSLFQNFGFTSSASPEPGEKEHGSAVENDGAPTDVKSEETNGSAKLSDPTKVSVSRETKESGFNSESHQTIFQSVKRRRRGIKRTAFSDSDAEAVSDLSMDDLVKLVMEKEELLKEKHKEMEMMQDKVLRTYAEMENVKERTKREAENSKKFAIQVSFAR
jgi:molecular chaperone GrpE